MSHARTDAAPYRSNVIPPPSNQPRAFFQSILTPALPAILIPQTTIDVTPDVVFRQYCGSLHIKQQEAADVAAALAEGKMTVGDVDYSLDIREPLRSILLARGLQENSTAVLTFREEPSAEIASAR